MKNLFQVNAEHRLCRFEGKPDFVNPEGSKPTSDTTEFIDEFKKYGKDIQEGKYTDLVRMNSQNGCFSVIKDRLIFLGKEQDFKILHDLVDGGTEHHLQMVRSALGLVKITCQGLKETEHVSKEEIYKAVYIMLYGTTVRINSIAYDAEKGIFRFTIDRGYTIQIPIIENRVKR